MAITRSTIDVESLLDEIELPDKLRKNPRFKPILNFHVNSSLRRLQYHDSIESVKRHIIRRVERASEDFLRHRWVRRRPPRSVNERYFQSYERMVVAVNEESKNQTLEGLRVAALKLLDDNLQDVINLRNDDFEGSVRHHLEKHDLTIFDGLFLVFSGVPFERGEPQLTINQYGGRPLGRYMFRQSADVWESVVNRILATRDLCYILAQQKKVWRITDDDFVSQSNPLRRSLKQLLYDIGNVYGTVSHCAAMAEAGVLTPENYPLFRKYNMRHSTLTQSQVAEISAKAKESLNDERVKSRNIKDFRTAGYTKSQIDRIFEAHVGILDGMGISVYDTLTKSVVDEIKALPWETKKVVGSELYMIGYGLDHIAKIIGTSSNPHRKASRQNTADMIQPSSLDKQIHYDTKEEKTKTRDQRSLQKLCQEHSVSLRRVKKVVDEYHDVLDVPRISEYFGIPIPVVSLYLRINRMERLPTQDVDLIELKSLHNMGYDVSPSGMSSGRHTFRLYTRLSSEWGAYEKALEGLNIYPADVYHRKRKGIAA